MTGTEPTAEPTAEVKPPMEEAEIIKFLEKQGCIIGEKRKTDLPEVKAALAVKAADAASLFPALKPEDIEFLLSVFVHYLDCFPIALPSTIHEFGRGGKYDQWRIDLPEKVRSFYEDKCCLRTNRITNVIQSINLLAGATIDGNICTTLYAITDKLNAEYYGKEYGEEKGEKEFVGYDKLDDEGKIAFTDKVAAKAIEVLNLIGSAV